MDFADIIIIAVGLAMDAFAVALGVGTGGRSVGPRATFRLSFHFGLFQFLMPVIGWFLGVGVSSLIASFDHWIAFGLLGFVGARMVWSGFDADGESYRGDPTRKWSLVVLSVATSIDALAVGLSFAMLHVRIWYPSVVIGIVAAALTFVGMRVGSRLGVAFGKRMEIVGGLVLIAIGIRVLAAHLAA